MSKLRIYDERPDPNYRIASALKKERKKKCMFVMYNVKFISIKFQYITQLILHLALRAAQWGVVVAEVCILIRKI